MARRLPWDDRSGRLLDLVRQAPRTGTELLSLLGVTPGELALIAHPLWHRRLLQGDVAEGCCGGADGTRCASCRLDCRWCLSKAGDDLAF